MTREELITHLEHLAEYVKYSEDAPALREVIEMLKCSEIPNSSKDFFWKNARKNARKYTETHACDLPPAQPDNRLSKIAELVEGTIDHFDLDDAMDLLYQIKEIVGNETSNIRG